MFFKKENKKPVDFTFKIGGEAGYGIMSSGLIFAKMALRSGYFVCDQTEYPSLIRGGHNTYFVRASQEEVFSCVKSVDLLVALNENAILHDKDNLSEGAVVLVNTDKVDTSKLPQLKNAKVFEIPMVALAQKIEAPEIMMNNVALGAAIAVLDADFDILSQVINNVFGVVGKEGVIDMNMKAARMGYDFVNENYASQKEGLNFNLRKRENSQKDNLFLTGNDGIILGAIKAGMKFFACYPMTPINSILAYFAKHGERLGIVYVQPEDEISAINMAIGASFGGARAMTASSGGGFSLMTEAYGMSAMTETPLVIIEGQRPGPATGLPTWGGQGDLRFVLHAAQDDFFRIVLAPGDPKECFELTAQAFNLAEKYQTPVVVLTDKHLAEGHFWTNVLPEEAVKIDRGTLMSPEEQEKEYKRYKITDSGISPRPLPGRKGFVFVSNSDEHNEEGFSEESSENRKMMTEKRMRKMEECKKEIPDPIIYGNPNAKITIVGWGSSKGSILEAQKMLKAQKIETRFLHFTYLNPLPEIFLKKFFSSTKEDKTIMIEQNFSAQCAGLIREKTGFNIKHNILSYDGRPFYPEDLVRQIENLIR